MIEYLLEITGIILFAGGIIVGIITFNRNVLLPIRDLKNRIYELNGLTNVRHRLLLRHLGLEEEAKITQTCRCGMVFKALKIRKKMENGK